MRESDRLAHDSQTTSAADRTGGNGRPTMAASQARLWARGLSAATWTAFGVALFPSPAVQDSALALLALLPGAGIALLRLYPLDFVASGSRREARPDLTTPVFLSGFGLAVFSTMVMQERLVHFFSLLAWMMLFLSFYAGAVLFSETSRTARALGMIDIVFFGCFYSAGLATIVNILPDRTTPTIYQTHVVREWVTHAKQTRFHLLLAPSGPIASADDVEVPGRLYHTVQTGDRICLGLHPGFLDSPWYRMVSCPKRK